MACFMEKVQQIEVLEKKDSLLKLKLTHGACGNDKGKSTVITIDFPDAKKDSVEVLNSSISVITSDGAPVKFEIQVPVTFHL